jgi:hypothetical protein
MTTGIYQLKFKSGKSYYGQALDIKSRFGDHIKAMKAGTASRKMQAEYDSFGEPELEVVIKCHPAYLTHIEDYIIYYNYGPNCLNTNKPRHAPAAIGDEFLEKYVTSSPSVMADKIVDLENRFNSSTTYIKNLKKLLDTAEKARDQETLKADVDKLVLKERQFWEVRVADLVREYEKPKKFLDRLRILFMGN